MTVELAKQLKDAGFPQPREAKDPYAPSLAELIESCGPHFWSLRRTPEGSWTASGRLATKENQIPYYESAAYDAPDIAVAELFLSIQLNGSH